MVLTRCDAVYLGKFNQKLLEKFDLIVSKSHSYYPDVIQIYKPQLALNIRPIDSLPKIMQICWDLCGEALRESSFRISGTTITYDGFYYHLVKEGVPMIARLKLIKQYLRFLYKRLIRA